MKLCSTALIQKTWQAYTNHRRHYVSPNTASVDYNAITTRLKSAPPLRTTEEFLDWLTATYSHESARRTLMQIKAAFRWAAANGHTRRDPFAGIPNFPSRQAGTEKYRAFSAEERRAILAAFATATPEHRLWAWGLFLTGCRPEELRALRVRDWDKAAQTLSITQAWRDGADKPHRTKNGKITPDFPVNSQLDKILRESTAHRSGTAWAFPSPTGSPFDYKNFQTRQWKPLLLELVEQGAVAHYLPQSHARHTWITSMVQAGMDINTIAYLARNSPAIIYRHYAQRQQAPQIPEI